MTVLFDPIQYKLNSKANWNTVALDYHYNWANKQVGPFKSTKEVIDISDIQPSDTVLDIACGTGVVAKEISRRLGENGFLVGIDLSRTALCIAKRSVQIPNSIFLEMDAENMAFNFTFDKVLCQYGLMFFPNVKKVLECLRKILKKEGKLSMAVHGLSEEVPYFSNIMDSIVKYIPDIRQEGTPTVHRFGDPTILRNELSEAGFSNITIKKFTFRYEAGTFEEYCEDYIHSTANSIWPKIEDSGYDVVSKIKSQSKQNASKYVKDGRIIFPWVVLIASASS